MKRDFKFRAWDKEAEIMINPENSAGEYIWEFQDNKLQILAEETVWREGGGNTYEEVQWNPIDAVIQEFTGLKDKNLKEIYEGDILETCHNNMHRKVEHFRGCLWFMTIGEDWKYPINMINEDHLEDMVVIGNVYETPSLLHTGA